MCDLLTQIKNYVPQTWNTQYLPKYNITILQHQAEFIEIATEIRDIQLSLNYRLTSLKRVQNIFTFGRYLFREQQRQLLSKDTLLRVRRYLVIKKYDEAAALEYNLNPRRYRSPNTNAIVFSIDIPYVATDEVVIIVNVISNSQTVATITPERDTDYFIEYVAEVQRL